MFRTPNIAVIGHLDHGKSTLIGRLLYDSGALPKDRIESIKRAAAGLRRGDKSDSGLDFAFLLDSLREERIKALTLDTAQVRLRINNSEYNIVDCPGHKQFIRNMLTGASQTQSAVLVVSAKPGEGVQEQTKLHILLTKILGIGRLVIAVNKMDLVGYNKERFEAIKRRVKSFLETNNCFKNAPFVPVSAKKGDNLLNKSANMAWYGGRPLSRLLDKGIAATDRQKHAALRLLIQDIYGDKDRRILVGRIESGILRQRQGVFLNISKKKARVARLTAARRGKRAALPGECISFRLAGADNEGIERGEVASGLTDTARVRSSFSVRIFVFGKNIRKGDRLIVRCGVAEKGCRIKKIIRILYPRTKKKMGNITALSSGIIADVEIAADEPMVAERFSRFPSLGRILLIKENKICVFGIIK